MPDQSTALWSLGTEKSPLPYLQEMFDSPVNTTLLSTKLGPVLSFSIFFYYALFWILRPFMVENIVFTLEWLHFMGFFGLMKEE